MGGPSSCNECGKKFKVFGIKKKCKHCRDVVCKACLAAHLLTHTRLNGSKKSRKSSEKFHVTGNSEQEELQFLSPTGSPALELKHADSDVLYGVDSIEAGSDEEDDGVLYDEDVEDDAEDDETLSRQSSIEEEEGQYEELCKIQGAVATWAIKEKHAKHEMQRQKDGWIITLGFPHDYDYENCTIFAVSYAVTATVVVWTLFGVLVAVYLRVRSLPAGYSHVLNTNVYHHD